MIFCLILMEKQLHELLQLAGTLTIKGLMGREHNDPDQYRTLPVHITIDTCVHQTPFDTINNCFFDRVGNKQIYLLEPDKYFATAP
jgi:hypothetical protein